LNASPPRASAGRPSALAFTLGAKIALTLGVWCVPLLLFPSDLLRAIGFPVPEATIFLRLLGMAYLALVLGYGFALRSTLRRDYPAAMVWVGIASNAGAFVLLLVAATQGSWAGWGAPARAVMWASLFGTGTLAAALAWFGPVAHRSRPGDAPR
jgi:hypothetical protein